MPWTNYLPENRQSIGVKVFPLPNKSIPIDDPNYFHYSPAEPLFGDRVDPVDENEFIFRRRTIDKEVVIHSYINPPLLGSPTTIKQLSPGASEASANDSTNSLSTDNQSGPPIDEFENTLKLEETGVQVVENHHDHSVDIDQHSTGNDQHDEEIVKQSFGESTPTENDEIGAAEESSNRSGSPPPIPESCPSYVEYAEIDNPPQVKHDVDLETNSDRDDNDVADYATILPKLERSTNQTISTEDADQDQSQTYATTTIYHDHNVISLAYTTPSLIETPPPPTSISTLSSDVSDDQRRETSKYSDDESNDDLSSPPISESLLVRCDAENVLVEGNETLNKRENPYQIDEPEHNNLKYTTSIHLRNINSDNETPAGNQPEVVSEPEDCRRTSGGRRPVPAKRLSLSLGGSGTFPVRSRRSPTKKKQAGVDPSCSLTTVKRHSTSLPPDVGDFLDVMHAAMGHLQSCYQMLRHQLLDRQTMQIGGRRSPSNSTDSDSADNLRHCINSTVPQDATDTTEHSDQKLSSDNKELYPDIKIHRMTVDDGI